MRVKLTQKYIDNPPPVPQGKLKIEHCDTALPGLLFEQRAVNTEWGSFRLRHKNPAGKTAYITVGRSCDISLQEARQKVKQLKAEIQLGADPQAELRANRKTMTVAEYAEQYLEWAKVRKKSWRNDQSMLNLRILPSIGNMRLDHVTRTQIESMHNSVIQEGRSGALADHLLKITRFMYTRAIQEGRCKSNPAFGISLFNHDNRVHRYLSQDELESLLEVLKMDKNQGVARLIRFLLCTGCRLGAAKAATWSQFDLAQGRWTIPASQAKSKKSATVPLGTAALELLESLPRSKKTDHLFFSERTENPYRCVKTVWTRMRKEAGISDDVTLHILRHTFASLCINEGRTLWEVSKLLTHSSVQVTERYAHLAPSTLQDAANAASSKIIEATNKAAEE